MNSILIVDDSPRVRRSLRNLLEQQPDWNVCGEATNGWEAIAKAQALQPDLIVLDMSMPIMDGLATAKEIKKLMPNMSILMFTAFPSSELERIALESGVTSVRSKSNARAFMENIKQLLKPAA
jgi:DNA-binding NarL/FixJ family response regulator